MGKIMKSVLFLLLLFVGSYALNISANLRKDLAMGGHVEQVENSADNENNADDENGTDDEYVEDYEITQEKKDSGIIDMEWMEKKYKKETKEIIENIKKNTNKELNQALKPLKVSLKDDNLSQEERENIDTQIENTEQEYKAKYKKLKAIMKAHRETKWERNQDLYQFQVDAKKSS